MKQRVLVSVLKEIRQNIEDWSEEHYKEQLEKGEMTFVKYLPSTDDWHSLERYTVKICVSKNETTNVS
jgi:hypothetical protein